MQQITFSLFPFSFTLTPARFFSPMYSSAMKSDLGAETALGENWAVCTPIALGLPRHPH